MPIVFIISCTLCSLSLLYLKKSMKPSSAMKMECNLNDLEALLTAHPNLLNTKHDSDSDADNEDSLLEKIVSKIKQHDQDVDNNYEPFYVLHLRVVVNLINNWTRNLPTVQPFYAVKCNTHPVLLTTLAALGSNFDCASRAEIETVLGLGVSPDRIIYANPCKASSHIKYAASVGVNLTTFDSLDEVDKIRKLHPTCALLIRVKAPDETGSLWPLGSKFGAHPHEVAPLLQAAQTAGLTVSGVSFHVGSASQNHGAYIAAIESAKTVFQEAARLGMPKMSVLNIGGGFMTSSFEEAAVAVKTAVGTYFEDQPGLVLIAEPGRFFADSAFSLVTNIIGKRTRGELRHYWINEGIHGSMMYVERATLAASCIPLPLATCNCKGGGKWRRSSSSSSSTTSMYSSTVFGPTCNAMDMVLEDHQLPELQVNDWLVFRNMGAYTSSCSSNFNGFGSAITTYLSY